jgi:hypothetical protein
MRPQTRLLTLIAALALAACSTAPSAAPSGGPSPTDAGPASAAASANPSPSAGAPLDRAGEWRADLAEIIPALERIHPLPYHGTSKADLEAAIAALSAQLPTLTDDEAMVGVLRIAALVSAQGCDGHTGVFLWGTGSYPVTSLPLRLWLFDEGLVIVDALPPYEHLIGEFIDLIDGRATAEVLSVLDPLIPRDNAQTVRLLTPRYILIPEILRGLGLADDGPITLRIQQDGALPVDTDVQPIPMAEYNAWAGPYGLHLPIDPDVLYLSRIDEDLWWERLADGTTLYVQYNRVERKPIATFQELGEAMRAPDVERIVFDIRHNFGGEVPVLDSITAILEDPVVNVPGKVFLLTGRNTLSAGSMLTVRVMDRTEATVVGESGSGCATFYGDVVDVPLQHSGLVFTVAEMLEVGVAPVDERHTLTPDVEAVLTYEDWMEGRDPALSLIVGSAP